LLRLGSTGLIILLGWSLTVSAQSIRISERTDTATVKTSSSQNRAAPETEELKTDPVKVVWWAAAIPGYGQIMNGKYWKLPIVYAGFLGCYYAINWNSNRYVSYKNGYLDITDTDDATTSYLNLIPDGRTMESYGGRQAFTGLLKSGMDQSRYYRDLTVIISIAYYGLTIVDAFVDAHLADFDISPDLSMKLRPMIHREHNLTSNGFSGYSYGLTGRVKF